MKEKKRYILFEVRSKDPIKFEKVKSEITKSLKDFVGQIGLEKMGLIFLNDWKNNKGILRVNNKFVDQLKACFVLMDKLMIRSLIVSGTLKKVRGVI